MKLDSRISPSGAWSLNLCRVLVAGPDLSREVGYGITVVPFVLDLNLRQSYGFHRYNSRLSHDLCLAVARQLAIQVSAARARHLDITHQLDHRCLCHS